MNLLILGGILEARQICQQLYDDQQHYIHYSLAGRTTSPILPNAHRHRFGGFGGIKGLCDYITQHHIDILLDITHPFASQISHNAYQACQDFDISYIGYDRPAYQQQQGDIWHHYADDHSAIDFLYSSPYQHIMLVGGQQALLYCQKLTHKKISIRAILPPKEALEKHQHSYYMQAQINMPEQQEQQLISNYIEQHHIDILVMKNSGGKNSNLTRPTIINIAKIKKIPIIMLSRPIVPHPIYGDMAKILTKMRAL